MPDQDAKLPIRSLATDANINVEQFNGNAISTNSGLADAGTVRVAPATDVIQQVNIEQIDGNPIATDYGVPDIGTQRVAAMIGVGSAAVSSSNPVPVSMVVLGSAGVHDYNTASSIASLASNTHVFTPAAPFVLYEIYYAASGQMKVEIQWGPTGFEETKSVAFTSKSNLTGVFRLTKGELIPTTSTIKIVRTNLEPGLAQDVYSSIHGISD